MASNISACKKQHPLAACFILAFAITWVLVSPLVLNEQGLLAIQISPHWHFRGNLGPIFGHPLPLGWAAPFRTGGFACPGA